MQHGGAVQAGLTGDSSACREVFLGVLSFDVRWPLLEFQCRVHGWPSLADGIIIVCPRTVLIQEKS